MGRMMGWACIVETIVAWSIGIVLLLLAIVLWWFGMNADWASAANYSRSVQG
jgi:hypothetical protein